MCRSGRSACMQWHAYIIPMVKVKSSQISVCVRMALQVLQLLQLSVPLSAHTSTPCKLVLQLAAIRLLYIADMAQTSSNTQQKSQCILYQMGIDMAVIYSQRVRERQKNRQMHAIACMVFSLSISPSLYQLYYIGVAHTLKNIITPRSRSVAAL